jgi:Zn-finger nucleic acid-binding protein
MFMAKTHDKPILVACPCCQAKLTVDPALGVVLSHEDPPRRGPDVDLSDAAKILAEQNRQREDKFRDSWFTESNKEDILAKKFDEAMKKAKDQPAVKPIRDFDLD